MEKKSYLEKLKDPRWQKKRLEILNRDGWKCLSCLSTDRTLHVHHIFYVPNREPWDVPDGLLVTLCDECHKSGPCKENIKSCSECPDFTKNDEHGCLGPEEVNAEIVELVARILNILWKEPGYFGGGNYYSVLTNAYFMLKPE